MKKPGNIIRRQMRFVRTTEARHPTDFIKCAIHAAI